MRGAIPIACISALLGACGPKSDDSATDAAGSSSSTGGGATTGQPTGGGTGASGSTGGPDPNYVRECQPNDFVCDDFGCQNGLTVKSGECYKRCTPDVIGGPDPECDEPQRPFCSQVGRALGGDYDCNGCAHICISDSYNWCGYAMCSG